MESYTFSFPGINMPEGVALGPEIKQLNIRNDGFLHPASVMVQIEVSTSSGIKQVDKQNLLAFSRHGMSLEAIGVMKWLYVTVWPSDSVGRLVIEAL